MVFIKVRYDAYNRQFKLIDVHLAQTLEDGETYMLVADVSVKDVESRQPAEEAQVDLVPATA
jgi:hypothetical protein